MGRASPFNMQHANQGKQSSRRGKIGFDLAFEPLHQQFGRLIVNAAPRHIYGFDLGCTRLADGLIITVADREIVFDDPAEPTEAKNQNFERAVVASPDIEDQPPFLDADFQMVRPGIAIAEIAKRLENIVFDQIEDRHAPLLLDIGVAPEYRCLIEFDFDDALVAHVAVLACDYSLSTMLSPILFFARLARDLMLKDRNPWPNRLD